MELNKNLLSFIEEIDYIIENNLLPYCYGLFASGLDSALKNINYLKKICSILENIKNNRVERMNSKVIPFNKYL